MIWGVEVVGSEWSSVDRAAIASLTRERASRNSLLLSFILRVGEGRPAEEREEEKGVLLSCSERVTFPSRKASRGTRRPLPPRRPGGRAGRAMPVYSSEDIQHRYFVVEVLACPIFWGTRAHRTAGLWSDVALCRRPNKSEPSTQQNTRSY